MRSSPSAVRSASWTRRRRRRPGSPPPPRRSLRGRVGRAARARRGGAPADSPPTISRAAPSSRCPSAAASGSPPRSRRVRRDADAPGSAGSRPRPRPLVPRARTAAASGPGGPGHRAPIRRRARVDSTRARPRAEDAQPQGPGRPGDHALHGQAGPRLDRQHAGAVRRRAVQLRDARRAERAQRHRSAAGARSRRGSWPAPPPPRTPPDRARGLGRRPAGASPPGSSERPAQPLRPHPPTARDERCPAATRPAGRGGSRQRACAVTSVRVDSVRSRPERLKSALSAYELVIDPRGRAPTVATHQPKDDNAASDAARRQKPPGSSLPRSRSSLVALTIAACGGSSKVSAGSTAPPTTPDGHRHVGVADNGDLGKILEDGQGRTLYLFAKDTGTTSTCTGPCAGQWPPLRRAASRPPASGPAPR